MKINSFPQQSNWSEVLRVSSTYRNAGSVGDRIPAIFANKAGFIHICTQVGTNANWCKNFNMSLGTWYMLELNQNKEDTKVIGTITSMSVFSLSKPFKYFYEIKLDGVVEEKVENPNPEIVSNVKIWAGRSKHMAAADVAIRNLTFRPGSNTTSTVTHHHPPPSSPPDPGVNLTTTRVAECVKGASARGYWTYRHKLPQKCSRKLH